MPQHGETGMTVSKRYGYIVVVSVVPDGPAEKATLRSGEILEVDRRIQLRATCPSGRPTLLLQGAPGTPVKVAVVRRGKTEPQEISINRAVIGPQHIVADRVGDDVAYVRLPAHRTSGCFGTARQTGAIRQAGRAQTGSRPARLHSRGCPRSRRRRATFPDFRQDCFARRANRFAQGFRCRAGQSRVALPRGRPDLAEHFGRCGSSGRGDQGQ